MGEPLLRGKPLPNHCPKCGHAWRSHERTGWPTEENPHPRDECSSYMGMGDWCGCKEKRPSDWSNVEDVIAQVEGGIRLISKAGRIDGYVIHVEDWQRLAAQLREED